MGKFSANGTKVESEN